MQFWNVRFPGGLGAHSASLWTLKPVLQKGARTRSSARARLLDAARKVYGRVPNVGSRQRDPDPNRNPFNKKTKVQIYSGTHYMCFIIIIIIIVIIIILIMCICIIVIMIKELSLGLGSLCLLLKTWVEGFLVEGGCHKP